LPFVANKYLCAGISANKIFSNNIQILYPFDTTHS
jgi:hypothetical protein